MHIVQMATCSSISKAASSFWMEHDKADFHVMNTGQLTLDYVEGYYVSELLRMECGKRVHTIVEIGTWNGLGSTLCILDGIKGKSYRSFHTLECNKEKFEQARINLSAHLNDRVHIIWGTILQPSALAYHAIEPLFPTLKDSDDLKQFMRVDISNCLVCPNVLDMLPDTIDFLLLDGGDFTTLQEFRILLPRCTGYIVLDDTYVEKCRKVREELLNMPEWGEIYSSDGRNGFSVFERREYCT